MTFAVPLKVTFRLFVYDKDPETGTRMMRDAKEEEVYFGDIPLMTDNGTFIINGTERVIVSQLHRSPGVFFTKEGPRTYLSKIIPYRGSWVEFEYDQKDVLSVRIDRKRKFHGTVFLRALGLESDESILRQFYTWSACTSDRVAGQLQARTCRRGCSSRSACKDRQSRGRREAYPIFAGITLEHEHIGKLEAGADPRLRGRRRADLERACFIADVVDLDTGEVIFEANELVPEDLDDAPRRPQTTPVEVFFPDWELIGATLSNTLAKDTTRNSKEALIEIYRRMRPGDPPTLESARSLFYGMFFDAKRYDFSRVGRFKFNIKLDTEVPVDQKTLSADDFFRVIEYLLRLQKDIGRVDDIDHLGNRRVRAVGELLENQFRIGLARMERAIKENMSVHQDIDSAMPHDLINSKPVIAAIKEFFGSSQLSQFMDQTNPLAEVTHKRRLSALGPGGLSRERAGFEVRDVHDTHYGRICPIETPEGPNIGLISSLATYARINEFGFIESPYKKVENGRVLDHFRVVKVGDGRVQARPDRHRRRARGGERAPREGKASGGRRRAARLLPLRLGRGEVHHRPGQRPARREGHLRQRPRHRARRRRLRHRRARPHRLHGRLPEAAGLGGRGADPVPRARRRQPRADGLQHAAPGRAAAAHRRADRRHRPRGHRGPGLRRGRALQARRHRRLGRRRAHHRARRGRGHRRPARPRTSAPTSTS